MNRTTWIDIALLALVVTLTTAAGVLSAYTASENRGYMYALCAAIGLVSVVQAGRVTQLGRRHDREMAALRAGQEYLAQPESYRNMNMLFEQHVAMAAADERFREHFNVEPLDAGTTAVQCKLCDWRTQQALLLGREAALAHLGVAHRPAQPKRQWRALLHG